MRDTGTSTLTRAYEQGRALGAFSTYTQEITRAICRAAQDTGQPVIIQAGASAFGHAGLAELAALPDITSSADVATALARSREAVQAVVPTKIEAPSAPALSLTRPSSLILESSCAALPSAEPSLSPFP